MEVKKSPKADLERFKRIFILIGVTFSLGIIVTFFSWKSDTSAAEDFGALNKETDDEMAEITRPEDIKPPEEIPEEVKPQQSEIIDIVTDDTEIEEDADFDAEADANTEVEIEDVEEAPEEEDAKVFVQVEKMPEFKKGGINGLRKFLFSKIVYPAIAKENDIQGTVYLRFVVLRNGKVGQVQMLRGVDELLDEEAKRVVKLLQKEAFFSPGEQGGKKVKVWFSVPIKFSLN